MRKIFRRLAAIIVPTAVVATSVAAAGVAEASICPMGCMSDERLKKNIRPI